MASAKRTPKVSRISRGRTLAYARKQKPPADGGGDGPEEPVEDAPATGSDDAPASAGTAAASVEGAAGRQPATAAARPEAAPPVEPIEPAHARIVTAPMPALAPRGTPPAMPAAGFAAPMPAPAASAASAATGAPTDAVEDPTRMPGPREIPAGHPDDPAAPPGRVPPGDSRSLRRRTDRHEFALVYRIQTYVISRVGAVGKRGQWRVVEYPTPTMASHAYAKECSRFVSDGFSDYRE